MRMDQHIKRMIEKYTIEASRLSGLEALENYNMAYTQAKELGNDFTLRACAANLGAMYISFGRKDDAEKGIAYLKQAIPPEGTVDCASKGDLYFNLALGFDVLGKFRDAGMYYEKALEEYKGERDNLNMETDTLKRLVQNSLTRSNEDEVIKWYKELEKTYGRANKLTDQFTVMVQRITRHKQLANPGNKELEAELEMDIEQCCQLLDSIKEHEQNAVGMLVQASVLLTKFKKLEKARQLLNDALMLFEAEDNLTVQKAVVLQNLGTVCNYLEDWEGAIPYHKQAAAIYQHCANLPPDPNSFLTAVSAQRCQGHCLAGHALALVHSDVDEARVLFDKARDLAVSSGDKDTVWQVDTALGAVHCIIACQDLGFDEPYSATTKVQLTESQLEHLDKSIFWYKTALEDLTSSPRHSQGMLDRVLDKYTQVQMFRENASKAPPVVVAQGSAPRTPPDNVTGASSDSGEEEDESKTSEEEEEPEENKEEETAEEGETKRQLTKTLRFPAGENDDDTSSDDGSGDDGDEDSDDDESSDESDNANRKQPKTGDAGGDDDDPEETQIKNLYRKQLGKETLTSSGVQKVVKADVHAQHKKRNYSSSAESGSTDTHSYNNSSGELSQEEFDVGRQVPRLPTLSPPVTPFASGTYETPQEAEMHINELYGSNSHSRPRPVVKGTVNYADIDVGRGQQGTSGSTQDPDYEPVNVRRDIKSPEPTKQDPSGKSKTCSIM